MSAKVKNNLPKLISTLPEALWAVTKKAGADCKAQVVAELGHPGHGRIYGKHQASAPGEPPARDTGFLASSVHNQASADQYTEIIFDAAEYAEHLENAMNRPFMLPIATRFEPIFAEAIAQTIANWSNQG